MSNTYTSSFQFVQDGQSTSEAPSDLVSNNAIVVNNAEIQWEGSTTTGSNTSYSTNTNTGSATATTGSTTDYDTNSVSGSATATETTQTFTDTVSNTASDVINNAYEDLDAFVSVSPPSYPGTAQSWELIYEVNIDPEVGGPLGTSGDLYVPGVNNTVERDYRDRLYSYGTNGWYEILSESGTGSVPTSPYMDLFWSYDSYDVSGGVRITATVTYEYTQTSVQSDTVTLQYPSVPSGYSFDRHEKNVDGSVDYIYSNRVGESVSVTSNDPNNTVTLELETRGEDTNYYTNSDTTYVSYPSVPNGYSFDRHYYREEKNGSYVDSDYSYSNKVGQSRSVTSNNTSVTRSLEMETRGEQTNTYTNYTNNPSVSGDVSASSSASLDDNETSSWQSLSGFGLGDNTLSHSIGDSGEGYYRIRFDWEVAYPTEIDTVGHYDGTTLSKGRLVDPNDEALEYDVFRTFTENGGILAFDMVDPSDEDVADFYINHPTHGLIGLRLKQT